MRVMRVLTRPNVGGPTRQAVALWHAHKGMGVRTLLVVGRCEAPEPALDLAALGVPRVSFEAVDGTAEGFVEVPALMRRLHPLHDWQARVALRTLQARFAPQVVHTHTSKAGALLRGSRSAGVRVVHTYHGHVLRDYYGRLRSALLVRLERRLAARTDALIAISPSCRDELVSLGIAPAARFHVVPPAVEVAAFAAGDRARARATLGLGPTTFALGFVGRLVPIKRPELFVDTVRTVSDALGPVTGIVFGDGPLRAGLAPRAGDRIRWLGARADLAQLLPACDALVFTSRREGCPLAAIEAFAAGVPVVGLDVPGVRDALATWGRGLLVAEVTGIAGLTAALASLREEPARGALVKAARAGLPRFAPAAVAAELLRIYEQAFAAATPPARPHPAAAPRS